MDTLQHLMADLAAAVSWHNLLFALAVILAGSALQGRKWAVGAGR